MGRRRSRPAVQAPRGRPPLLAGVHRRGSVHDLSLWVISGQAGWPPANRVAPVEMASDDHAQPGARASPLLGRKLEDLAIACHGVIGGDDAVRFLTQDGVEIRGPERDKGTGGIARTARERAVMPRQKDLGQIAIRALERRDARHAEFVD